MKSIKLETGSGEQLKVELDPSGIVLACSSQDRHLRLYHLQSGELLSKVAGHSELITGLKFTADCQRLISVSGKHTWFKQSENILTQYW